jgi:hypothetical protein
VSDALLFVSHVEEDRAVALQVVRELERRDVRCWIAPRDISAGSPYDDKIVAAIQASRAMLLIYSARCNESEYIRRELTIAGNSRKVIITFRIEDTQPKGALLLRLADLQWIDAFVAREPAIDDVVRAVAEGPVTADEELDRLESHEFSTSLREHMTEVHRHIEALTQDQCRVMRRLDRNRRVLIDGCAGSGKTLVAAEKAVRVAKGGFRTLLLCHSPLLAKHIAGLTRGTPVAVWAFGDWVRHLALTDDASPIVHWTHYDEPESATIKTATRADSDHVEAYPACRK